MPNEKVGSLIDQLSNISQCSIGGIFHELMDKSASTHPATPVKLNDSYGHDFIRLLHKNKSMEIGQMNRSHPDSPDFRPAIYLDNSITSTQSSIARLGNRLYYSWFQHEDRYFNQDRDELSKDIFPVGQKSS
ncbi:hypothetical protein BDB01DRAFT_802678 [Pilobolus umbonatus]|nr:hypothetical protein BDB01DRAFT_802678 [Pilobolus umbonatus]